MKKNNSIFPFRQVFGKSELKAITNVFRKSWRLKQDFGYNGYFENLYTKKFVSFLKKPGYADAVNSGTSALFAILQSLKVTKKALISPVTNPGSIMPLALLGYKLEIVDSEKNSFNISVKNLLNKIQTTKIGVLVVTHYGGIPVDLDKIKKICEKKKIFLIEDCSQAHGAIINNQKVGTFGHFSFFSTMYRKNLASGGIGGIYFTKNKKNFLNVKSHADRGKHYNDKKFNTRDFHKYKFPALNLNLDELSCALGYNVLLKLPKIINKRYQLANIIKKNFVEKSKIFRVNNLNNNLKPSLYFLIIDINTNQRNKKKILNFLNKRGVEFNPKHREIVAEWKWIKKYISKKNKCINAFNYRQKTINLYLNEKYSLKDIKYIINSFLAAEKKFINYK